MIPRYEPTYNWSDALHSLRGRPARDSLKALRSSLARLYRRKHVFLFGTARAGLYALLRVYKRPGRVLMPAYNCIAVPEAVLYAGYRPAFVDVGEKSFNMTAAGLKRSFSSETTVVLITHQFGIPCELDEILHACKGRKALIVEDAAAALGARFQGQLVGTFGDAAIVSFHVTKVVSGGAGGALLLNDDDLAERIDRLQQQLAGSESHWLSFAKAIAWRATTRPWLYRAAHAGYRLLRGEAMFDVVPPQAMMPASFFTPCSKFCAALMLRQLDRLETNVGQRRAVAERYAESLSGNPAIRLPVVRTDCSPAWTVFPVLVNDRKALYEHLQRHGIDSSWTFRYSCAESFGLEGFRNAGRMARTVVGLPTYPSLSEDQTQRICIATAAYRLEAQTGRGERARSPRRSL